MMQLEHLVAGDWDMARRNFERLRDTLDTGNLSAGLRFGQATATWAPGGVAAATLTITHGLGRTPVFVNAASISTGGPFNVLAQPINVNATTFQLVPAFSNGAAWGAGGSHTIVWAAIG